MSEALINSDETISYERLYRLWEQNQWSATSIDFAADVEHWRTRLDDRQREAALWNYAMFLVGEESVARTLTPVVDAVPTHAQGIFLSTQVVDEARHHVFFDRFIREVCAQGDDTRSTLEAVERHLTWGFRQVFAELDRVTEDLRKHPEDRARLTQAIALYHIVVEGMLAIPGQHFIQRYVKKFNILPGFAEGIANVARDESRHVAFGVKLLGELAASSRECRHAAVEMWDRVSPGRRASSFRRISTVPMRSASASQSKRSMRSGCGRSKRRSDVRGSILRRYGCFRAWIRPKPTRSERATHGC